MRLSPSKFAARTLFRSNRRKNGGYPNERCNKTKKTISLLSKKDNEEINSLRLLLEAEKNLLDAGKKFISMEGEFELFKRFGSKKDKSYIRAEKRLNEAYENLCKARSVYIKLQT